MTKTIDLLEKVFEFIAMTPDEKDWDVKKLKSNRSRQARLQQIEALLIAFGLHEANESKGMFCSKPSVGKAINSLLYGEFIEDFKQDQITTIDAYVSQHLEDSFYDRKLSSGELRFIYQYLIRYRKQVNKLQRFNSGWLEAGGKIANYAIGLTSEVTNNLNGKTEALDALISFIINPNQVSFTQQELIERFHYPDVDLLDIDLENW